jgi:hypothetical protein
MWNTALGKRTLIGAERRMVVHAAWELADSISASAPEDSVQFGIVLFDRLSWQHQMLMLEKVLSMLVDPSIAAPKSSALLDATVAAIYAQIRTSLEIELDHAKMDMGDSLADGDHFDVRMELIDAMKEPIDSDEPMDEPPEGGWPTILCDEIDEWDLAIESLRGRILADEDWQMEAITIDLAPRKSKSLKQNLGIDRDYFIDIPPDGNDDDAEAARLRIVAKGKTVLDEPIF